MTSKEGRRSARQKTGNSIASQDDKVLPIKSNHMGDHDCAQLLLNMQHNSANLTPPNTNNKLGERQIRANHDINIYFRDNRNFQDSLSSTSQEKEHGVLKTGEANTSTLTEPFTDNDVSVNALAQILNKNFGQANIKEQASYVHHELLIKNQRVAAAADAMLRRENPLSRKMRKAIVQAESRLLQLQ